MFYNNTKWPRRAVVTNLLLGSGDWSNDARKHGDSSTNIQTRGDKPRGFEGDTCIGVRDVQMKCMTFFLPIVRIVSSLCICCLFINHLAKVPQTCSGRAAVFSLRRPPPYFDVLTSRVPGPAAGGRPPRFFVCGIY